ncbi:GTP-binding protein [uncultured Cohaesibacter sp.]|uniref:CobW family GTP-binding protein n=1 Tax=uncultured Cohaesibacter sp. TaxID=1002546 RepID=UPI002AABDA12|nr:GTP-binding protein [uncultured Cohaesibacter sp.]
MSDTLSDALSDAQTPPPEDDASTIPVTIITGFLGAGKTTLLNGILQDERFKTSLVLVNEFGEVGIDHLLIENLTDDVVLLKSGCVCCSLRGEMAVVLLDLAAQRDADLLPPFDHVILETTGLADPAPIMQILMTDPLLQESYHLGRVVTVVDCVHGSRTLESHKECLHQAAMADCLLISKSDLATECKLNALENRLNQLNPGADIFVPVAGRIDPQMVLGDGRVDVGRSLLAPEQEHVSHDHHHDHDNADQHGHNHHDHHHQDGVGIQTFLVPFDRPPLRASLMDALEELGRVHGDKLLRFKGLVQFEGEANPTLLQGVQELMHPPVALTAWPEGVRQSGLVFIVDGLASSIARDVLTAAAQ